MDLALLVGALVIILAGAEIFTNSVERMGHRPDLAEGAVGGVLAAVGTAMPETMIPLVAIVLGPRTRSCWRRSPCWSPASRSWSEHADRGGTTGSRWIRS